MERQVPEGSVLSEFLELSKILSHTIDLLLNCVTLRKASLGELLFGVLDPHSYSKETAWEKLSPAGEQIRRKAETVYNDWEKLRIKSLAAQGTLLLPVILNMGGNKIENFICQKSGAFVSHKNELKNVINEELQQKINIMLSLASGKMASEYILFPDHQGLLDDPVLERWKIDKKKIVLLIESSVIEELEKVSIQFPYSRESGIAKGLLKQLKQIRKLGDTGKGVEIADGLILREETFEIDILDKSLAGVLMEGSYLLEPAERKLTSSDKILLIAQKTKFQNVAAAIYLITPSLSLQRRASDLEIRAYDPEDFRQIISGQRERVIIENFERKEIRKNVKPLFNSEEKKSVSHLGPIIIIILICAYVLWVIHTMKTTGIPLY